MKRIYSAKEPLARWLLTSVLNKPHIVTAKLDEVLQDSVSVLVQYIEGF